MKKTIGFSRLTRDEKIEFIARQHFSQPEEAIRLLQTYQHTDPEVQKRHDEFIENSLTNFYMPYGVAPNFLINGTNYTIPMVIEESSVVAAAAKSASFWFDRGGFQAQVLSTRKIGHVHFLWNGNEIELRERMPGIDAQLRAATERLGAQMKARGGGIIQLELLAKPEIEPGYYQLKATFETCDAMGANFINSHLECFARELRTYIESDQSLPEAHRSLTVVMSILSNYTPECLVRAEVTCAIEALADGDDYTNEQFVDRFLQALHIAREEPYRAVTHNKGIMNGIDAVVLATGNDFRAVEACAHAYAARDGQYRSLTQAEVVDGQFRFWLDIPLALGTVGGLTSLHPMVRASLEMLNNPHASQLMEIVACVGLAQNFSAVKSLVTTGIQKGHMKMHLLNILNQLGATEMEKERTKTYFSDKSISFQAVGEYLKKLRGQSAVQVMSHIHPN
jgi:hydroxymethylglutaryl-CoA reductase